MTEYSVLQSAQINRTRRKLLMQHKQSCSCVFLSSPWERRRSICIHPIYVKNNRRFPLFIPSVFILLTWVICKLPFVWNGRFLLKRNRNLCQMLLSGADSHSCNMVLTCFKMMGFWLDRSDAMGTVRHHSLRGIKLHSLKPKGGWMGWLWCVGCLRLLLLCDL